MMSDEQEESVSLYKSEVLLLQTAAKLIDEEAQTWVEGFSYMKNGERHWDAEDEWAKVRWFKLKRSADHMRGIAARFIKKQKATHPSQERTT